MKDVLWTSLVGSLQSGQCVLVLGHEIPALPSRDAPGSEGKEETVWEAFCRYLAKQLVDENQQVVESALFAVAQQYEDLPTFATHPKYLAVQFFRESRYEPGSLHSALAALPFGLVVTTCYDDLFYRALRDAGKSPSRYIYHFKGEPRDNQELPDRVTPDTPAIYHLFGELHEPNSLVVTENDLLEFIIRFISGRPKLPDSLRSALRNKTFLFIGFGIRHWYIRVLLKLLVRPLDLTGGSVALEPLSGLDAREREQTVLFYKRGRPRIEVVDMDIREFLTELRERLGRAGGFLGTSARISKRAQVFISYERSDEEVARRLFEALPRDQFDPWLDTQLLEGGEEWNARLEEKIQTCDYFVVLHSERLARKQVGYVNKEIRLALDQQTYRQRGLTFIIPLLVGGMSPERGLRDFEAFQQLPLRPEHFGEDVNALTRSMSRDFQRRNR